MNNAEFEDSPTGTLVNTALGMKAFVPHPLPPAIEFDKIVEPLSRAMLAIGHLNGCGSQLDNPYLVVRPLQRQEALISSAMEGTYTTANALALAEASSEKHADDATIEVQNYTKAFEHARAALGQLPISNRLICDTHRVLLNRLSTRRGANKKPGEYKDQQNFISGATTRLEDARFIPPPPLETIEAMHELEKYINRENSGSIPPLIDAALMHYQFETIHPFNDGNGRVGRILIPIYLIQKGILTEPLLYISPAIEGDKGKYVDLMLNISKNGDWTKWIEFFLEMIINSCERATSTINKLTDLRAELRKKISDSGGSARYATIADGLFTAPVISIPQVAKLLAITYPAAQNAVERLIELDILTEIENTSRPKYFVCWPVLNAIDTR